jgi:hypothetical protein
MWFMHYDLEFLFPNIHEDENGAYWACDDSNYCLTFREDTMQSCNMEGDCYTPEDALALYFGEDVEPTGSSGETAVTTDYDYSNFDPAWAMDTTFDWEAWMATRTTFGEQGENFNFDDWRSNFDMNSSEYWFMNYDLEFLFPNGFE